MTTGTGEEDAKAFGPAEGESGPLPSRNLTRETLERWKYSIGNYGGRQCHIANFYEGGRLVGQKLRFPGKAFKVLGNVSKLLYGKNLWGEGGKRVIITEGEIDAMSVSQVQDHKWPVVSLPNGAGSVRKALGANLEWLDTFEEIVLMFDNDPPGNEAVDQAIEVLPAGKVKVAVLPLKDASEMVQAGREAEVVRAIWNAKVRRPDGVVTVDDVIEEALKPVQRGIPWFLPTLDTLTFGRRYGEIVGIGAGTGIGKTDFITQQVAHDISLGLRPAVFFLEQLPSETLERVAGKTAHHAFHVPDGSWTEEDRRAAFEGMRGKFFMYDSFGSTEWGVVKGKLRYLAVAEGVRVFYIDHLTAMSDPANERETIEQIMKEMATIAIELRVWICFVSHLSTPEGKPHEEGGRVTIRNFKGSRSIGFWSHYLIGLERDQQDENPEAASRTTLRVLKDRKTGRATGKTIFLSYDHNTTLLSECEPPDPFGDDGEDEGHKEDF